MKNQITKVTNPFETVDELTTFSYPATKLLVIPEIKREVSFKNILEFTDTICLALLHKMNEGYITYEDMTSVLEFKNSSMRDVAKTLFEGKFKPGQTKKGFGPFFGTALIEALGSKSSVPELRILRDLFYIATLMQFISIGGLDDIKIVYNIEQAIVKESNLLYVCQGASILNKFRATINLISKAKVQDGFFHPEEWMLLFKEFRNRFIASVDSVISFSNSVEVASVLCLANRLRLRNKFMLANNDLLESVEADSIISVDQFVALGLKELKSISTLLGESMTPEIVRYCIRSTLEPINSSNLLNLVDIDLYNCVIHSYRDYALNSSTRGAILLKTAYLENPMMAIRAMDSYKNMYSYSTEFIEHIGKNYSSVLNEILQVTNVANFESASERADFAIKGYYTNLSEQDLRILILKNNRNAVEIGLPLDTESLLELDTILTNTFNIKIVYNRDINKNQLEFDDVLGFKLVDSLTFTHPFIVALHSVHNDGSKYKKIVGERGKSFFPKFNYSSIYLTPIGKDEDIVGDEIESLTVTEDENTMSFEVDYRSLCGIPSKGRYILTRNKIVKDLFEKIPLQKELKDIFSDSFMKIYKDNEKVTELQNDIEFRRVCSIVENSLFFKRLGAKVYNHLIQDIINNDGLISQTNISALHLNSLTNLALIELVNRLIHHILGTDEIKFSEEVENSQQIKYQLITGGSYENI